MTRNQEDKLSMWTTVEGVLSDYPQVWPKLAAFNKSVTIFRAIRLEIDPQANKQRSSIVGITEDKHVSRQYLTELTQQTILNIEAYAKVEKNHTLQKQFSFTPSYYDRLRDNELPVLVNAAITKALELAADLEPYGITQDSIQELADAAKAYNDSNASPRIAVVERKNATINIAGKLEDGLHELKIMDNLIGNFNRQNPDFVAAFRGARKFINLGSHKKKVVVPKETPPTPPTES